MGNIFDFPFKVSLKSKLQWMQYHILHRIVPTIIISIKLGSKTLLFLLMIQLSGIENTQLFGQKSYIIANHERSYLKPTYSLNHLYSLKRYVIEPHPFCFALYSLYVFLIVILLYSYQLLKLTLLYMRTFFLDILSSGIKVIKATLVFVSL